MKGIKLAQFIGRQLSRLKAGQTYYAIAMSTVSALSLVIMAFPWIGLIILIILFPLILFGAYFIGLFMDKSNIAAIDHMKTTEMSSRYLNIVDIKYFEFYMTMFKSMFKWMESIQKRESINIKEFNDDYNKFLNKWKQPKK